LTAVCVCFLKHKGSRLGLLKSTFNAKKFRTQVVLVYLQPFRRSSVLKCALNPKIAKNSLKTLLWGLKVVQGHRCW